MYRPPIDIQYQICTIFRNMMNYLPCLLRAKRQKGSNHTYHYLPNLDAMLSISKDSNARKHVLPHPTHPIEYLSFYV